MQSNTASHWGKHTNTCMDLALHPKTVFGIPKAFSRKIISSNSSSGREQNKRNISIAREWEAEWDSRTNVYECVVGAYGCCWCVDIYTLELPYLYTHLFFFPVLWYNFHRLLFDDEKENLYQQSGAENSAATHTDGRRALWPVLILTSWREQLASGGKKSWKRL